MPNYNVRQGDSTVSLAYRFGFFSQTIWDHARNAEIRKQRGDKNILYPGDVLYIPDRCEKAEEAATEQRHRFRRRGVPERIRLRFVEFRTAANEDETAPSDVESVAADRTQPTTTWQSGQAREGIVGNESAGESLSATGEIERQVPEESPRSGVPYSLDIDGRLLDGETDDDGAIEFSIAPDAQLARVTLNPGTPQTETHLFQIGDLNPASNIGGVKQRLTNLGYDCGEVDEQITPELQNAVRRFQEAYDLPITGDCDQSTRTRLVEIHQS